MINMRVSVGTSDMDYGTASIRRCGVERFCRRFFLLDGLSERVEEGER